MPCLATAAATALTLLGGVATRSTPSLPAPPAHVREIADLMLPDVAVAEYHPAHSIIFYNPRHMALFSPGLQAFFLAHEHAHLALKHTRAGALGGDRQERNARVQAAELEADCLAVKTLGSAGREISLEAMRYFGRQGAGHFDNEHPTGTARARNILDCMPE
jgi:hypothetical protein